MKKFGLSPAPIRLNDEGIKPYQIAGHSIWFHLDVDEYDNEGNTHLKEGSYIMIPPEYLSEDDPAFYEVVHVGRSADDYCVAIPLRGTAHIIKEIPGNYFLMVGRKRSNYLYENKNNKKMKEEKWYNRVKFIDSFWFAIIILALFFFSLGNAEQCELQVAPTVANALGVVLMMFVIYTKQMQVWSQSPTSK